MALTATATAPPNGADVRKVAQVAFKPDWTRHAKATPFKRDGQMLDVLPTDVVVFPGTGIQDNLADKAKKIGIPLFDFRTGARARAPFPLSTTGELAKSAMGQHRVVGCQHILRQGYIFA